MPSDALRPISDVLSLGPVSYPTPLEKTPRFGSGGLSGHSRGRPEALNPTFEMCLMQEPPLAPVGRKLKIACLDYTLGAVSLYRVWIPLYYLKRMGLVEHKLWEEIYPRAKTVGISDTDALKAGMTAFHDAVEWADIVLVGRPYSLAHVQFINSVKRRGKLAVVDTDDYLDAVADLGESAMSLFWLKDPQTVEMYKVGLQMADLVTVSSKGIAERYRMEWPEKVVYLPNPMDTVAARWNVPHSKYPDTPLTIGYWAGFTHGKEAAMLKEPMLRIMREFPALRLKFIGLLPHWVWDLDLDSSRMSFHPGEAVGEFTKMLGDIDIALAPLEDHEFNRVGKSDTKIMEATMAGCATVASPIGEYLRWPSDAVTFANDPDSWYESLKYLIEHPSEIRERQRKALRFLLRYRSAEKIAIQWYSAYRNALDKVSERETAPYGVASALPVGGN